MRACSPALAFVVALPLAAYAQHPLSHWEPPKKVASPQQHFQQFPPNSGIQAREVQDYAKTHPITYVSPKDLAVNQNRVSDGDTVMIGRPGFGSFQVVTTDGVHHPVLFPSRHNNGGGENQKPAEISIRVMHADAAEVHVPDGHGHMMGQGEPGAYATNYVQGLMSRASKIDVVPNAKEPIDKYGRVLGEVYVTMNNHGKPERIDVNRALIKGGYADMYEIYAPGYDAKQFQELSALSANAIKNRLGIYGKDHHLNERPYIFRAHVQDRPIVRYVANMKTHTVYGPEGASHVPISQRLWI